jgi:hypothetical protein
MKRISQILIARAFHYRRGRFDSAMAPILLPPESAVDRVRQKTDNND